MKIKAPVIVAACLIRALSNLIWPFWGGPTLYYVGQTAFEVMVLWALWACTTGHLKTFLSFFLGLACFALLKEALNPTELDLNEYIGFLVGAGFVTYQILKDAAARKKP
jgi:hypothetical protein